VQSTADQPQFPPPGEALFRELQLIHGMLRRDLSTVQQLADEVIGGASAEYISAEVESLQTNSPLWKFRV
jgi:hypothetical protein